MVEKPVLITDAAPSLDDDLARRRRTYLRIMVVHLVGFGLSYPLYLWQWWAGALAVLLTGGLPWVAVVLATAVYCAQATWILAAQSGSSLPGGRLTSWSRSTRSHHTLFRSSRSGSA